jgi:hypothetical protein
MYLCVHHRDKLLVIVAPQDRGLYAATALLGTDDAATAAALSAPLSTQHLWAIFCARIPDFPARFCAYSRLRALGWFVRDGQAFGGDFVCYEHGPGFDHAPHCIALAPMALATDGSPTAADGPGAEAGAEPAVGPAECVSASLQVPTVRSAIITRPPLGSWLDLQALGRVISSVKKHMLVCHCTLHLPPLPPGTDACIEAVIIQSPAPSASSDMPAACAAGAAATDDLLTRAVAEATSLRSAPVYSRAVARYLSSPWEALARTEVQFTVCERWLPMREAARKHTQVLSKAAKAAALAELDSGVRLDMRMIDRSMADTNRKRAQQQQREAALAPRDAVAAQGASGVPSGDANGEEKKEKHHAGSKRSREEEACAGEPQAASSGADGSLSSVAPSSGAAAAAPSMSKADLRHHLRQLLRKTAQEEMHAEALEPQNEGAGGERRRLENRVILWDMDMVCSASELDAASGTAGTAAFIALIGKQLQTQEPTGWNELDGQHFSGWYMPSTQWTWHRRPDADSLQPT